MNTIEKSNVLQKTTLLKAALPNKPLYTIGEEIANSVLHGIGVLGAITGLVILSLKTRGLLGGERAAGIERASVIIFAATMITMFFASTLYHAVQHQKVKYILRKLDHSAIYIFIAGTYTPFCLIGLGGAWGWSIFAFEWSLALIGITLHFLGSKIFKKIEIVIYLLMGWAIVVGFFPLIHAVSLNCVIFLFTGGAAYTLGAVFYRQKHLKLTHVIWHVFVIAGTVCHWFAVWNLS